ncbi:MAG: GntR family transcriptional regulator [Solirubrobacterales bacterium]
MSDKPSISTALQGDRTRREGDGVVNAFMAVREAILLGRFKPGERVSQVAMATELDLGRTPLREALRMLQRDGLIRFEPNQRIRIAGLGAAEVEGLCLMRLMLEAAAIRITIPALGPREIARLEELLASMEAEESRVRLPTTADPDERMRQALAATRGATHREFHARLVADAGEPTLARIAEMSDHADRHRMVYFLSPSQSPEASAEEHRALVEAASQRDVEATVAALAAHYTRIAEVVIQSLDPGFDAWRLAEVVDFLGERGSDRD